MKPRSKTALTLTAARITPRTIVFCVSLALIGPTRSLPAERLEQTDHRVLFTTTSLFGDLAVTESRGIRYLFVDGVLQTAMVSDPAGVAKESHFISKHYWLELLPYFHPEGRRCLLIGLGGGLLPAVLAGYGVETHGVEIDPKVLAVAREYFGYRQTATVCDGRDYLARYDRRFDFIVIDAFAGAEFPYSLASKECFELAGTRLRPNGVLALNLIGKPSGSRVGASVVRTLKAVFAHVSVYRTESHDRVQSLICFAGAKPLRLSLPAQHLRWGVTQQQLESTNEFKIAPSSPGSVVLTDDHNPLDSEWSKEAGEWRQRMIRLFGRPGRYSREE